MIEDPKLALFEAYCTGVIESVILSYGNSDRTSWSYAEMAALIITRRAAHRSLIKKEAEGR